MLVFWKKSVRLTITLLGQNNQAKHEYLFWDYPEYAGQQAVRMGQWKGIRKNIKKGNLEIELYNTFSPGQINYSYPGRV